MSNRILVKVSLVSAMKVNHMLLCCIYSRCNIQRCVSKQLR